MRSSFARRWRRFWTRFPYGSPFWRTTAWLSSVGLPPHTGFVVLAGYRSAGFVAHTARISHAELARGERCFIGNQALILQERDGGSITLGSHVHIHEHTALQTGQGGYIRIGDNTHIQPRCQLSAYLGPIRIGSDVEIAPSCAFYSYSHGYERGRKIQEQPISSSGGIEIRDGAWLGYGAVILDGATIGRGAVISAGSVVSGQVPDNAIAGGAPARIIGFRP